MTEREAFIRSICEEPEDDLRRLVFADWLDENGENRFAKYIRDSIADTYGGQYTAPSEMVRESRPFFDIPDGIESVQVRRGFIQWVSCTEAKFKKHARRLFRKNPITYVTLLGKTPFRNIGDGFYEWSVHHSKFLHFSLDSVHVDIYRNIPMQFKNHPIRSFLTYNDAMNALSVACVNYGRSLAGLPPLKISPSLPATST